MVNLTNDEWRQAMALNTEPGPNAKEYGHRGLITAKAIQAEKTQVEADDWIASAPVDEPKETR